LRRFLRLDRYTQGTVLSPQFLQAGLAPSHLTFRERQPRQAWLTRFWDRSVGVVGGGDVDVWIKRVMAILECLGAMATV
jgi:hypothetical protein